MEREWNSFFFLEKSNPSFILFVHAAYIFERFVKNIQDNFSTLKCIRIFFFFSSEQFSVKSGEWEIEDIEMSSGEVQYSCCPDPFSVIKYRFSLRRMALYYFLYIILPLVSQVFLFLMVFHIPCENGERMGFGVTILLSITVYLLVISEKLPEKSDDRPMLGICFIIEFYVLSLALVIAAIIVKLSNRTSPPPHFLLRFCGASKSICCGGGYKTTKTKKNTNKKELIEMHEANGYLHSKDEGIRFLHQRKTQPVTEQQPPPSEPEIDEEEMNRRLWRKIWRFFLGQ